MPPGLPVRYFSSGRLLETSLGNGAAGAQMEAVLETVMAAAAFLGVEYVLTRGRTTASGGQGRNGGEIFRNNSRCRGAPPLAARRLA